MKIIICGAGQVGYNIAQYLEKEDIQLVVIERDPILVQKVNDTLDVKCVEGMASHPDVLEKAGAKDAEILIAVTQYDEVNMMTCQVAHSLFNVPFKIARIRNRSYLDGKWSDLYHPHHLPIDHIISPEIEVSQAIARNLETAGAFDVIPLAHGAAKTVGVRCSPDCPVINTPLRQLTTLFPDLRVSIILIIRDARPIMPTKDDQLLPGDEVYFVADANHVTRAMSAFGYSQKESRNMLVVGGGNIGLGFCYVVEEKYPDINLSLIEKNPERARYLAETLNNVTILNGDAMDSHILRESGVPYMDTVVSVMSDDEDNIILSLMAKRYGAKQVMTLLNNPSYIYFAGSLGVDGVINPRSITVSSILQHVRRGRIRSIHSLCDGFGEIIELDVHEDSKALDTKVADLMIPGKLVVAAIYRKGQVIRARKSDQLQAGDRVILFVVNTAIHQIESLFSSQKLIS